MRISGRTCRRCLLLTQWTAHLERFDHALRDRGHDPVVLRGGMGAKKRTAALDRLTRPDDAPLLVIATGPYIDEAFDCPILDTLFLAAPVVYRELDKMENEGLITARVVRQERRPNKRMFSLTQAGRRALRKFTAAPLSLSAQRAGDDR